MRTLSPITLLSALIIALTGCKRDSPEPGKPDSSTAGPADRQPSATPKTVETMQGWIESYKAIEDDEERLEFVADAIATGADDMPLLVGVLLEDSSSEVRREAMQAMPNLDPEDALPLLKVAANDADEFVRDYALTDIKRLPKDLELQSYADILSSDHLDVRQKAVSRLANKQNPAAFSIMLEALNDEDEEVRAAVNRQAEALIGQRFDSYQQASAWWAANKGNYDEFLQPR